jgi:hypothetical protein
MSAEEQDLARIILRFKAWTEWAKRCVRTLSRGWMRFQHQVDVYRCRLVQPGRQPVCGKPGKAVEA